MTAFIICGGILQDSQKILEKIKNYNADFIIACDSGYDNALKLGIKPEIVVGDFDSIKNDILDCEIIKLPTKKDDTDLRVAVDITVQKKCENVIFLCATGGRIDHFYGNMSHLEYLDKKNISATIIDEQNIINICKNKKTTYKNISQYISIIPITEKIVLTTENLEYKAEKLVVNRENIISISNECEQEFFSITVDEGKAYIIQSQEL